MALLQSGLFLLARNPLQVHLRWVAALTAVVCLLQLAVEGYRWQIAIGYLALAILLIPLFWPVIWRFRLIAILPALGILSVSAAAAYFFPVFSLPQATGKYPVGVRVMHLVDSQREDTLAPVRGQRRELMIQIWYPAQQNHGDRHLPYADARLTDWKSSQLIYVRSNAFLDAPVESEHGPFPLIVLSPHVGGQKYQYSYLCEELASHGFVVIGMDHPYGSSLVIFPDGRTVPSRPRLYVDFTNEQMFQESVVRVEQDLAVRSADAGFVLETAKKWSDSRDDGPFAGRIDTTRAGIIGHSFGGAVAAETCRRDARFLAGINLDGSIFGEAKRAGVPKPFLFALDDVPRPKPEALQVSDVSKKLNVQTIEDGYADIERSLNLFGGYFFQAKDLQHMNYSDYPLYSRLKRYTGSGYIPRERAHAIIRSYVVSFFSRHLKGNTEPLLNIVPSPYPEVRFRTEPPVPHTPRH